LKHLVVPPVLRSVPRTPPFPQRRSIDLDAIRSTIDGALCSAGLSARSNGVAGDVAATIDKALSAAGLTTGAAPRHVHATVLPGFAQPHSTPLSTPASRVEPANPGEFLSRSFACGAGTRAYKLYVPSIHAAQAKLHLPLVVMLHGCTQSAEDFAAGTRMNTLAEQQGFLVAYPEQATNANGSRCWNWFRASDQQRDSGEPSLIAGITREISATYRVDERRIYVAGLSAGAAMAVVLGATYPDLYAAVGAHSGLAYASAHDVPSAFAAMKGGGYRDNGVRQAVPAVPTIVFHGDADKAVASANGALIIEQAIGALRTRADFSEISDEGLAAGHAYTRARYCIGAETPIAEQWTIRGAGHAWSGGSSSGSYTDAHGPDASAEMLRFFKTHAR